MRRAFTRWLRIKHPDLIPYYVIMGGQRVFHLIAFLGVVVAASLSYGHAESASTTAAGAARDASKAAKVAQATTRHYARLTKNTARLARKIEREGAKRRDQACRGLELAHRQEVKDLRRTFRFYEDPPPSFADLLDNPLVLQGLSEQIRAAAKDQDRFGVFVPAYCDEPHVGIKEPDPVPPKHPPPLVQQALDAATP